jgi:hypothetical protein
MVKTEIVAKSLSKLQFEILIYRLIFYNKSLSRLEQTNLF